MNLRALVSLLDICNTQIIEFYSATEKEKRHRTTKWSSQTEDYLFYTE